MLLANHFPDSLHQDILNAVDLTLDDTSAGEGRRDPRFRNQVLTAYEHRCAVCGFQLLLSGSPIALDAAHIKWHQAAGPGILQNGICLCVLHHKTFDLGVFTVGHDSVITVSEEASGICGFQEAILAFHGKRLRSPIQQEARPAAEFIDWHWREVFRGKPRPFGTSER
jgi:putative restriction endonuclease